MKRKRSRTWTLIVLLLFGEALIAAIGQYGLNALLSRGGGYWTSLEGVKETVPAAMLDSLEEHPSPLVEGPLAWTELEPGFEVAELEVRVKTNAGKMEFGDSLLLTRMDPTRFAFQVRLDPTGSRGLNDWLKEAKESLMIINGSYYGKRGDPSTPVKSFGLVYGPKTYSSDHGLFVSIQGKAQILDARDSDWKDSLAKSENGVVSYPLLFDDSGQIRSKGNPNWLANRSFVAEDRKGRILFGTTTTGLFSLRRLAEFLQSSSLELRLALNLDGGPVACQGIQHKDFSRNFCGSWEMRTRDEGSKEIEVLKPGIPDRRWALPIVLTVVRK